MSVLIIKLFTFDHDRSELVLLGHKILQRAHLLRHSLPKLRSLLHVQLVLVCEFI